MSTTRPNLLVMVSHDLGRHLGCYGVPTVRSEHLDGLAAEGVRMAQSFCAAPQCSPSRASIFTGRYPHNNGVMGLTHADFAWDLYPEEQHLAQILGEAGYHTALAGVQHEARTAGRCGFHEIAVKTQPASTLGGATAAYLRAQHGRTEPFYLQVGFIEPHRRFTDNGIRPDDSLGVTVPPWLADEPGAREEFAGYQGAIRALDGAVGEILAALDDAELRENTLVVFTADHGMPFPRAKCSVYDPGLQTPLILRWPAGGLAGGAVHDAMISNIDYLPTWLELLDLPAPAAAQGRSFAPLLRGQAYAPRAEIFGELTFHDYIDPQRCIRTATHKLIAFFSNAPSFMDPSQTWRPKTVTTVPADPAYAYHAPIELYDLAADPLETVNLADDPAHAAVRDDLLARLRRWMEETDDPLLTGIPLSPMHRRALALLGAERHPAVGG